MAHAALAFDEQAVSLETRETAALHAARGISFERVVAAVEAGGLLDVLPHPNPAMFSNQRVMVVAWAGCAHVVPFVAQSDHHFLKTVIPSRQATRAPLKNGQQDAQA